MAKRAPNKAKRTENKHGEKPPEKTAPPAAPPAAPSGAGDDATAPPKVGLRALRQFHHPKTGRLVEFYTEWREDDHTARGIIAAGNAIRI